MNLKIQSGRSMVEMLGTLAIIGVLSIGAIAGYSYGMDKYRANQSIHDIMLRVVDLMTQAARGHETLSLSAWDNEKTIYDISNPAYVEDEMLIAFDLGVQNKIPKRVCEMLYDGLFNEALQIDVNAERADSKATCGTDNTMTFYFTLDDIVTADGELGDNDTENNTQVTEETATVTEEMATTEPTGDCSSNNACTSGAYCAALEPTYDEPFPSGRGICTPVEFNKHTITINGIDEVWYVSKNQVENYWDGYHFCEKLGKTMVSASDLYTDSNYGINNYRAELLKNILGSIYISVSEPKGLQARLDDWITGGEFHNTGGYALCYEGTLADL